MDANQVAAEVRKSMDASKRALTTSTAKAMKNAGDTAVKSLRQSAQRNAPGLRFRNMHGAHLDVDAKATQTSVTVTPRGPWGILEPGAKGHAINSRRRRAGMPIGGGKFRRGPFRHPGTPNTAAWSKGQAAVLAQVGNDLPETIGDEVERAFSG